MRSRKLGGNVESKIRTVRDKTILEFEFPLSTLFDLLLRENGIKDRINALTNILEQDWETLANAHF